MFHKQSSTNGLFDHGSVILLETDTTRDWTKKIVYCGQWSPWEVEPLVMLRYEPCPQAWDRAELLGVTSGPASWINDPIGEGREKPFGLVHVLPLEMLLHVSRNSTEKWKWILGLSGRDSSSSCITSLGAQVFCWSCKIWPIVGIVSGAPMATSLIHDDSNINQRTCCRWQFGPKDGSMRPSTVFVYLNGLEPGLRIRCEKSALVPHVAINSP